MEEEAAERRAHAPGPAHEMRTHGHRTDYHDSQRLQIQTLPRRRPRTREDRTDPRAGGVDIDAVTASICLVNVAQREGVRE